MFNIEHNVFCSIVEIGHDFIIIDANGSLYTTTMDLMIILF